ncbi:MAG TPA: pyrroline-5-carboxylate reductase [Terriglobales bacterium]|nr:pyrroline-5-carboxylate reductase [Terriglobales bacterium]
MERELSKLRVAVIGAGKIGTILLQGMLQHGLFRKENVHATVQHGERACTLEKELGVRVTTDNVEAVRESDVVLVCVKPQMVGQVMEQIAPVATNSKLFISVAASVPTDYMEKRVPQDCHIIRAMPNTPSMVGVGMTALSKGKFATQEDVELALALFNTIGRTVLVDEKHMDAITGLSASGPAFIYIVLESLAEGGVKVGLPRDMATLLAAQMTLGAAKMVLETGHHPALLKDAVTTPAGCTIDGILELEEGKIRVTLIKAVVKAALRAKELVFS